MKLSKHAMMRSQQRGIPEIYIQLLIAFGRSMQAKDGAQAFYLDRKAERQLEKILRQGVQVLDKVKGKKVIISDDGVVITCYHSENLH